MRILAHVLPYVKANSSIRAAGVGGMASRYLKHFDEQLLFLFLFLFFWGGEFNAFVVCFQRKVQRFVRLVLLSLFFFFFLLKKHAYRFQ